MRVPVWLTLGVAILVIVFGLYRMRLAFTKKPDGPVTSVPRRGLYAMRNRTHALIGIVYLLLGGALIATTFGWNPVGGIFGPPTAEPAKVNAPVKGGIPIDQLPPPPTSPKK